jgi:nucleoid DNA-binding protein
MTTINLDELSLACAQRTQLSRYVMRTYLETVINAITTQLRNHGTVDLDKIGTLKVRTGTRINAINPATGAHLGNRPLKTVRLKQHASLKHYLN